MNAMLPQYRAGAASDQGFPAIQLAALPHYQRQNNNGPSLKDSKIQDTHAHWLTYTFVEVFVSNLPRDVTTQDIHRNFLQHGTISKISISEAREASWGNKAEIIFK